MESNCQLDEINPTSISFFHNNHKIADIQAGFKRFEHCFLYDSINIMNDTFKFHLDGDVWSDNAVSLNENMILI